MAGLVLVDAAGFKFEPESLPLGFRIARIPVLREPMRWVLPRRAIEDSVMNVYGDPARVTAALVDRYYELTLREGNRAALMRRMDQLAPGPVGSSRRPGARPSPAPFRAAALWFSRSSAMCRRRRTRLLRLRPCATGSPKSNPDPQEGPPMKTRLLALALLTAGSLVGVSAQAQAPEWKKVRIGVEGAYPPFSEIGPDGKLKGFEIELVQAYCAEMKAQCTLVQQDFDGLIPALQSRKVDAIFASVSITEERQKVIAFSKPYYNTPRSARRSSPSPSPTTTRRLASLPRRASSSSPRRRA